MTKGVTITDVTFKEQSCKSEGLVDAFPLKSVDCLQIKALILLASLPRRMRRAWGQIAFAPKGEDEKRANVCRKAQRKKRKGFSSPKTPRRRSPGDKIKSAISQFLSRRPEGERGSGQPSGDWDQLGTEGRREKVFGETGEIK